MTITLTPEQEHLIQAQVATGQFRSVEEVIDTVLNSLRLPSDNATEGEHIAEAQAAAERIRELRKGITLDRPKGVSLRDYAHIGHRY